MDESGEPIQKALVDKQLTKYWQAWPRDGDIGVVAIRNADSVPVCCAWVRRLLDDDPADVGDDIVELAIGTVADERGGGLGTQVLGRLIEACQPVCKGIFLSVRTDNPAVRFYERFGFIPNSEITNRVGTKSLTMTLRFAG
jgi:GNAT superfamily N-acetyltransferase